MKGFLLCWPCHHAEKRRSDGAYSKQTERKIAALELKLGAGKMWKVEVVVDIGGAWCGNDLRFATKEEAETYARDLVSRWAAVLDWRAVQEQERCGK